VNLDFLAKALPNDFHLKQFPVTRISQNVFRFRTELPEEVLSRKYKAVSLIRVYVVYLENLLSKKVFFFQSLTRLLCSTTSVDALYKLQDRIKTARARNQPLSVLETGK